MPKKVSHLIISYTNPTEEFLLGVGLFNLLKRKGYDPLLVLTPNKLFDTISQPLIELQNYTFMNFNQVMLKECLMNTGQIWLIGNQSDAFREIKEFQFNSVNDMKLFSLFNVLCGKNLYYRKFPKNKHIWYLLSNRIEQELFISSILSPYQLSIAPFWPAFYNINLTNINERKNILIPLFGNFVAKWRYADLEIVKFLDQRIDYIRRATDRDLQLVLLLSKTNELQKSVKELLNSLKRVKIIYSNSIEVLLKEFSQALITIILTVMPGFCQEEWLAIMHHTFIIYYSNPSNNLILQHYPFTHAIETTMVKPFYYLPTLLQSSGQQQLIFEEVLGAVIKRKFEQIYIAQKGGTEFVDILAGYEPLWDELIAGGKLFVPPLDG